MLKEIRAVIGQLALDLEKAVVIQRALEVPDGVWQSVLYAERDVDLTDRLIERLNARYARQKK